ncbi:MAG: hypothetical protein OEO21_00670 [Candidatus Krumholzibacteria bacterium]|nr:hypothetical protein [Candidatus Krumholzibacteria bacterium]
MIRRLAPLFCACWLAALAPARAQAPGEGQIDISDDIGRTIERLERRVGGDLPAEVQATTLQWLIELYTSMGDYEGVERSYQRIFVFFPNDVGTRNTFARFLMDVRGDFVRAERELRLAHGWATVAGDFHPRLGETYLLRAELMQRVGEPERALRMAEGALAYLDESAAAAAWRIEGHSYAALVRYDEAAHAYLRAIAIEGGRNDEDINALALIAERTNRYAGGGVREAVAAAIAEGVHDRRARIEAEGAEVVILRAADGVALEATLRRAGGQAAVLFVPDLGGRRSVYAPYEQLLFTDDVTTLSLDPRGHGDSRSDSLLSVYTLPEHHRERLSGDVAVAMRYLTDTLGVDAARIAVVSAGAGCALVEKALFEAGLGPAVVHLSPDLDAQDLDLRNAVAFHPDRPVAIVLSEGDLVSLRSERFFREVKVREQMEMRLFKGAGHGAEMLSRSVEVLLWVQSWILRVVGG